MLLSFRPAKQRSKGFVSVGDIVSLHDDPQLRELSLRRISNYTQLVCCPQVEP